MQDPELEPQDRTKQIITIFIASVIALVAVAMLIAGIATHWDAFLSASNVYVQVFLIVVIVLFPLSVLGSCIYAGLRANLHIRHEAEGLKAKQDERRRANEAHEMQLHLARTRLLADERGNRPYIFDDATGLVIPVDSGNVIQPVPHTYSPHMSYSFKDSSITEVSEDEQKQLVSPLPQPTIDFLTSQLQHNGLQVCLGVSTTSGQPFIIDLVDGTHYRIIGSSGYGKSCEAAAMLDMTTQTNDPDHLLIALLDLEHKQGFTVSLTQRMNNATMQPFRRSR